MRQDGPGAMVNALTRTISGRVVYPEVGGKIVRRLGLGGPKPRGLIAGSWLSDHMPEAAKDRTGGDHATWSLWARSRRIVVWLLLVL